MWVATVGCGYWGKNLVRNFAELGALAAICDPNRAAAEELADRYHAPVAKFEEVLRDTNIAGVAIAAPAVLHAELAQRAERDARSRALAWDTAYGMAQRDDSTCPENARR